MIVDCHTHINCQTKACDAVDFNSLLMQMDAAFVLASPEESNEQANRKVSDLAKQNKKVVGFAVVNPLIDPADEKTLKSLKEDLGFQGIVLYCPAFGMHPAHTKAMQLYEAAQNLKMPVFFHNSAPFGPDGVLDFAQPYMLDEIARTFPELKIVLGSLGRPFIQQGLAVIKKNPNVFGCLTVDPAKPWQLYNTVMSASEADVMDKLVFGSGYPFADASQSIEALLGFKRLFADTQLPTVARESVRAVVERDSLNLLGIAKTE